jgi:phosphoribosylformimino-5-aminoimidazole carboxamide ribonucleotide (ProFAR) isomerase
MIREKRLEYSIKMEKELKIEKPEIVKVSVEFTQEGNTLRTTSEVEHINVSLEFQQGEKDGPFITIKTNGWSMDDMSDLEALIKRAKKILKQD